MFQIVISDLILIFSTIIVFSSSSASLLTRSPLQPWDPLLCDRDEISCLDRRRCIPKAKVCDRYQDCIDNSDETDCENSCPGDSFQCDNGKCIERRWMCDTFNDCGDSSDEIRCLGLERSPCPRGHYRCDGGPCISANNMCDGKIDCLRGDDEARCELKEASPDTKKVANATPKEPPPKSERDQDRKPQSWSFDASWQAYSDELWPRSKGVQSTTTQDLKNDHKGEAKVVNFSEKGSKLFTSRSFKSGLHCSATEFKCADDLRCIPLSSRCNHRFDCVDQSDEQNCLVDSCTYGLFRCQGGKCAISSWQCNATDWLGRRVTVMAKDFETFL